MNIQDQIKRYKAGELNSREGLELLDAMLAQAAASYEPKGADLHVRMALLYLDDGQISGVRECLDCALDALAPPAPRPSTGKEGDWIKQAANTIACHLVANNDTSLDEGRTFCESAIRSCLPRTPEGRP